MKKKTIISALIVVVVFLAVAVFLHNQEKSNHVLRAMYVPLGEKGYVMIDQNNGTVFTVNGTDIVLNEKGQKMDLLDLEQGNIVDIYGSGVMAESFPGQYMGVEKMTLVKKGDPSDANQYKDITDAIYVAYDVNQIPSLGLEYTTTDASVLVTSQSYAYSWNGEDNYNLEPLEMEKEDIVDVVVSEPVDMTLDFSSAPQEVKLIRWSLDDLGKDADGEEMAVSGSMTEGYSLNAVEPGYVYSVEGSWEQGTVRYVFYVESRS